MDMAGDDERIYLFTGDLGFSIFEPFMEKFPSRYFNMGVAEQNMMGVATGMALSGKIIFVYSIANFPTFRCLEQIRNDVCYHNVNVNIVTGGGGLSYGALGITHHATEDIAIMRALPNMTVIAPGDPLEAELATQACAAWPGPCYLRLGKTTEPQVHESLPSFSIGRAIGVKDGKDATLISTGCMLNSIVKAAGLLAEKGISARVLSMPTVKPMDRDAVLAAARETGVIVTVEEHSVIGGLGSAVAEVLSEASGIDCKFRRMGIKDAFTHDVGNQEYLLKAHGLSVDDIVNTVIDLKKEGR
jgi:transketolase